MNKFSKPKLFLEIGFFGQFIIYGIFIINFIIILILREKNAELATFGYFLLFLLFLMFVCVFMFYISVGFLAKRCEQNWLFWVIAPMIIGPFGFLVVYFFIKIVVNNYIRRNQNNVM